MLIDMFVTPNTGRRWGWTVCVCVGVNTGSTQSLNIRLQYSAYQFLKQDQQLFSYCLVTSLSLLGVPVCVCVCVCVYNYMCVEEGSTYPMRLPLSTLLLHRLIMVLDLKCVGVCVGRGRDLTTEVTQ